MAGKKVIETFVNVFKVDATNVVKEADKVAQGVGKAQQSLKGMDQTVKQSGQGVNSVSKNFKSLSSAIQVAATSFGLFRVLSNNVAISNIARSTGQGVSGIQALQRQFESMGYSAQEANSAVNSFNDNIAKAVYRGEGDGLALPAMFGVDVFDRKGQLREAQQVLLDIGDAARALTGSELAARQMLGTYLSPAQADFAASTSSRTEYEEQLRLSRLDEGRISRMREINKAWARQKDLMGDVSTEVLVQLSPALLSAAESAKSVTSALTENKEAAGLALKAFITFRLFAINPILGALAAAGFAISEMNEKLEESVRLGGSKGTYLQNLILTDPESGASAADVLPEDPASYDKPSATSDSGVLKGRYKQLADVVAKGESNIKNSNNGYNAFNRRNRRGTYDAGVMDLTSMTIGQIQAAQQSKSIFAAGRYQTVPNTLAEAVKALNIRSDQKFDEKTQDQIFKYLVDRRGPAARDFLQGKSNDLASAQKELSKEWAAISDPFTGRSYYHGKAGNRASIFTADLQEAFRNNQGLVDSRRQSNTNRVSIEQVIVETNSSDPAGIVDAFLNYTSSIADSYEFNSGASS